MLFLDYPCFSTELHCFDLVIFTLAFEHVRADKNDINKNEEARNVIGNYFTIFINIFIL